MSLFFFFFFFVLFRAALFVACGGFVLRGEKVRSSFVLFGAALVVAYGSSETRGKIGTTAADLHHSHSSTRSQLLLQPTPQLTPHCILNPLREARGWTYVLMDPSQVRYHLATTRTPLFLISIKLWIDFSLLLTISISYKLIDKLSISLRSSGARQEMSSLWLWDVHFDRTLVFQNFVSHISKLILFHYLPSDNLICNQYDFFFFYTRNGIFLFVRFSIVESHLSFYWKKFLEKYVFKTILLKYCWIKINQMHVSVISLQV